MKKQSLFAVALTGLALSLTPTDAFAQGSPPDVGGGTWGWLVAGSIVAGGVVVGGLVTDGMVFHDLARGQGVRRGPAIAGTALWGIAAAVMIPLSVALISVPTTSADGVAALLASDALVLGSLGVSIYGLTLPAPAAVPAQTPWQQRVAVHPMAIPAANSVAPGMGFTFRM